jgi:hypothetical protein
MKRKIKFKDFCEITVATSFEQRSDFSCGNAAFNTSVLHWPRVVGPFNRNCDHSFDDSFMKCINGQWKLDQKAGSSKLSIKVGQSHKNRSFH